MIEHLLSVLHAECSGPDCWHPDPHYHQHWMYWPDDAGLSEDDPI